MVKSIIYSKENIKTSRSVEIRLERISRICTILELLLLIYMVIFTVQNYKVCFGLAIILWLGMSLDELI